MEAVVKIVAVVAVVAVNAVVTLTREDDRPEDDNAQNDGAEDDGAQNDGAEDDGAEDNEAQNDGAEDAVGLCPDCVIDFVFGEGLQPCQQSACLNHQQNLWNRPNFF